MDPLAKILKDYPIVILDGALATELERRGCDLDHHPQVAAVGVNCTPPRYVPDLIRAIGKRTDKPIVVYPNSGERYDVASRQWHGASTRTAFSKMANAWYRTGARIIGGCCRTGPADIRAIAAWARTQL